MILLRQGRAIILIVSLFTVIGCGKDLEEAKRAFSFTFSMEVPESVSGLQGQLICGQDCIAWVRFSAPKSATLLKRHFVPIPCGYVEKEFQQIGNGFTSGVFDPRWEPDFSDSACFVAIMPCEGGREQQVLLEVGIESQLFHVVSATGPCPTQKPNPE